MQQHGILFPHVLVHPNYQIIFCILINFSIDLIYFHIAFKISHQCFEYPSMDAVSVLCIQWGEGVDIIFHVALNFPCSWGPSIFFFWIFINNLREKNTRVPLVFCIPCRCPLVSKLLVVFNCLIIHTSLLCRSGSIFLLFRYWEYSGGCRWCFWMIKIRHNGLGIRNINIRLALLLTWLMCSIACGNGSVFEFRGFQSPLGWIFLNASLAAQRD